MSRRQQWRCTKTEPHPKHSLTSRLDCPGVECRPGEHLAVIVYTRPLRRLFRQQLWRRCQRCNLRKKVT